MLEAFARNFCSPPRLHPDIWSAQNVRVNSDVSEFYDPAAAPYFVQPMRAIFNNSLREICVIAPPGCGKTALLEAMICYVACCDPGDVLVSSKNEDLLKQWLTSRLNPILGRCAPLKGMLPKLSDRQQKLLLLRHMFVMSRAANIAGFQQVSVRWALGDECWQWDAGLIGYLRKRLHDRWNGRAVLLSQAGYADTEWDTVAKEGDQFSYLWKCVCGCNQPFRFADLKWEGVPKTGEIDWSLVRETIRLVCPACSHSYRDTPQNRRDLSSNAEWSLVEHGEDPTHQTYTIPGMANFRVSWYDIAREFLKARRAQKMGDSEPFMQWTMQRDSRFWKTAYEKEETQIVKSTYSWKDYVSGNRVDNEAVRFMTVDVQETNTWVVIRAWRHGAASRLLRFAHVMGGEDELREMQQQYRIQDGCVYMDARYKPTEVYTTCSKFQWWAIMGDGANSFPHPKRDANGFLVGNEQKLYSQVQNIVVGKVHCRQIKLASERLRDITARLRDGKSLPWEIPSDVPNAYVQQIFGEVKKEHIEPSTKRSIWKWTKVSENHAFDMEVAQTWAAIRLNILRLD